MIAHEVLVGCGRYIDSYQISHRRLKRVRAFGRRVDGPVGSGAFGEPVAFDPAVMTPFTAHLDDARAVLGEQSWQKARDEGAALGLDAALRLALDR